MVSRISGRTKVIGLFGSPIGHSRSPVMQNSVFAAMGLDFVYVPFDTGAREAAEVVRAMRVLNLHGANVTMPLKRAILPHLDVLSPAAELSGAVNVIERKGDVLTGHMTDGAGFMLSLAEAAVGYAGRRMVLLGAGGAAIAVAVQAALEGVAEITLFNRRDGFFAPAAALLERLGARVDARIALEDLDDSDRLASAIGAADILVNATPVGMHGAAAGMALPDPGLLRPGLVVCDLIYVPRDTPLLVEAARRGCVTVSGLGMQLYQAVPAFRLWTGQGIDVDLARRVLFEGAA